MTSSSAVVPIDWFSLTMPLVSLAGSLLIGLWLRRFAIPRLLRWASHTQWEAHDVILRAIHGPIVLWSLMAGMCLAMKFSPIPRDVIDVAAPVLQALWIFSVAWVSANAFAQLIAHYATKWRVGLPMTSLTQNLAKLVILALGLLIVLDSLGVKIASLLAALGIGSLAVALGLQDTLANLFAGVYVTLSKHISLGDYIRLENGEEGYVADIGWRATTIRMLPDNVVIVPNAKLSQSIITNYYLPDKELAVLAEVGVDYATDLERVERVTCEVARDVMNTVQGGVPEFEPLVRYHAFGDSSIQFSVVMRAKEFVDQFLIKHEFIKRLHKRYRQEGITIPFPVRTIVTKTSDPPARA